MPLKLPPLAEVLDLLPDAVCMVDPEGQLLMVNAAFQDIFGYTPAEVVGRRVMDMVHPDDLAATLQAAQDVMDGHPQPHFRNRYLRKDGSVVDVQWSARWLPDYAIRIAVGHQITELRDAERMLEHMASHDPLTGLANRYRFHRELEAAVSRARDQGEGLAVLYIDLDGFKAANDQLGHEAGDRLLQAAARCLRDGLRQSDMIARVGGDEFAALLPGCGTHEAAAAVAEALRSCVAHPTDGLPGVPRLGASVGIACYPVDGTTPQALLRSADAAMYRAKAARPQRRQTGPLPQPAGS